MDIAEAVRITKNIMINMEKVIVGKSESIELVLMALLCRGHVLIEDVPGVGKTSMVSALAKSVDASFRRVQFTPDIMPSDITGFSVYNPKTEDFTYKPGAIMSSFILADEINRTSPKTQASLLEVMEENQVTVDGISYPVPQPFMVLATQNPVEYLGTYPLPEAQLDRFFMKVTIGYPAPVEESKMLSRFKANSPLASLNAVTNGDAVSQIQNWVEEVHVDHEINHYIVALAGYTRNRDDAVALGVSPRASICLYKASQAWAMYSGRNYVIPDDVRKMAPYVWNHRIILRQDAKHKKITALQIIDNAIESVKIS